MTGRELWVSDLDGTLLRPDARLSAASAALLAPAIARGAPVTVATARSWRSAGRLLEALPLRLPVVTYGGAVTVDPIDGTVQRLVGLDPTTVTGLLAAISRAAVGVIVYWMDDGTDRFSWLAGDEGAGVRSYLADRPGDPRRRPLRHWDELDRGAVFAMTVIGDARAVGAVAATVGRRWPAECHTVLGPDLYHHDETWLEITAPGADKGTAVVEGARRSGAGRIGAYGDNENDLPLFRIADEAVAVANAIPAVRAAADVVIGPNTCDAVASHLAARAAREVFTAP